MMCHGSSSQILSSYKASQAILLVTVPREDMGPLPPLVLLLLAMAAPTKGRKMLFWFAFILVNKLFLFLLAKLSFSFAVCIFKHLQSLK